MCVFNRQIKKCMSWNQYSVGQTGLVACITERIESIFIESLIVFNILIGKILLIKVFL